MLAKQAGSLLRSVWNKPESEPGLHGSVARDDGEGGLKETALAMLRFLSRRK